MERESDSRELGTGLGCIHASSKVITPVGYAEGIGINSVPVTQLLASTHSTYNFRSNGLLPIAPEESD